MHYRCNVPHATGYAYYGGRGIKVCERWNDVDAFIEDMGYSVKGMSLDRIDSNGNYEPSNCRWIERNRQILNTRMNIVERIVEYKGETMPLTKLAKLTNIAYATLYDRIRKGQSIETATRPVREYKKTSFIFT